MPHALSGRGVRPGGIAVLLLATSILTTFLEGQAASPETDLDTLDPDICSGDSWAPCTTMMAAECLAQPQRASGRAAHQTCSLAPSVCTTAWRSRAGADARSSLLVLFE